VSGPRAPKHTSKKVRRPTSTGKGKSGSLAGQKAERLSLYAMKRKEPSMYTSTRGAEGPAGRVWQRASHGCPGNRSILRRRRGALHSHRPIINAVFRRRWSGEGLTRKGASNPTSRNAGRKECNAAGSFTHVQTCNLYVSVGASTGASYRRFERPHLMSLFSYSNILLDNARHDLRTSSAHRSFESLYTLNMSKRCPNVLAST
jgi:hypothetical protein